MLAYVSLWSADPLALGTAVDTLEGLVEGFHIDVFDGHNVRELLFGPDLVSALRRRTGAVIDVHLNVADPEYWIARFAQAGADMITVQSAPCRDVHTTLERIRAAGVKASLGLELHEPTSHAVAHFEVVDRVLLMGTAIGVRGAGMEPGTPARVGELVAARRGRGAPLVVVDGGIRAHTVTSLAAAGADGVVPGSLVWAAADPAAAVRDLHRLGAAPSGRVRCEQR